MSLLKYLFILFQLQTLNCYFLIFKHDFLNKFDYEICQKDSSLLKINNILLTPNPPVKGQELTLQIDGFLHKSILNGSELKVVVKYKMITVYKKLLNFCDELKKINNSNLTCPILNGEKSVNYSFTLPNEIPNGNYIIDLVLYNQDKNLTLCSKIMMEFS